MEQSFPLSEGAILQFNCNGISNSHDQLDHLLRKNSVLVACIQESKLRPSSNFKDFPQYTAIRRDRPGGGGGGGLVTLVHSSVDYIPLPSDHLFPNDVTTEHLAITAFINEHEVHIFNIYIPPASSCPPGFAPALDPLFQAQDDTLILGDFNAHHPSWYSSTSDSSAASRGDSIQDSLTDSDLVLLNTDQATRLPTSGNPSSPDLSIASPHIAIDSEWRPIITGNSDHLPIIIQLGRVFSMDCPEPPRHTFTNFRKANWEAFTAWTEERFAALEPPTSCSTGEGTFRRILLDATKQFVPKGNIPNMIPNLSDSTKRLIRERDTIRAHSPTDPRLPLLNQQVEEDINKTNQKTWIQRAESCSHKHNPSQFFSLIKQLSGQTTKPTPNQPIFFNGKVSTRNGDIAGAFNRQFSNIVPHSSDPHSRLVKRELTRTHPLNPTSSPFSPDIVAEATRNSGNSRAVGPDGLTIHQLKHLGPTGINFLTDLFNLSYNRADIPAIWKTATVIPLLKPAKPADQGSSYRPISILCPAAKVFERLLLPELNSLPLSPIQHGFRAARSTTTALLPLVTQIAQGFNKTKPDRTTTMAIDLSKAFDMVNHTKLLAALNSSDLRHNTLRWLSAYLKGRVASCRYNSATSRKRFTRTGVPQGSCISPVLFNFFVSSYPQDNHLTLSYADDFTDSITSRSYRDATPALTLQASRVHQWANERGLALSAPKSTITLFTPQRSEVHDHPEVLLDGEPLPLERNPRILGVTFDPLLTFSKHVEGLCSRAAPRLNILKSLTGSTWGHQVETITTTYKLLVRSVLHYAAPVWFPNTAPSNINKLQRIQNSALRVATGCTKRTPIPHLHEETRVLPISDHLSMLSQQFLARSLQPGHPSHPVATAYPGPRGCKATLRSAFFTPHFYRSYTDSGTSSGIVPSSTFKSTIQSIHTDSVRRAMADLAPNKVLNARPPSVSAEEQSLPRPYRTTLSRLRAGQCPALNSYQAAVGRSTTDRCPSCGTAAHTTNHLFSCPSHPTDLTPLHLWSSPTDVADFVAGLPCFSLPPLERPPPEPPPPFQRRRHRTP